MTKPAQSTLIVRPEIGRSTIAWSPPLVRVAELQAARGQLRLAADLTEALLGDDRIRGLMATRAQALFGLKPTFDASAGDGRRRSRAIKAIEAEEDWWAMMPEDVAALHLTWALLLGVSLGRLEWWETDDRGKRVPRIRKGRNVPLVTWWHPRVLRWDETARVWLVRLDNNTEQVITPGDGEWLLFTPYGPAAPWLMALWRGLAPLWMLKRYALRDLGRHLEKGSALFIEASDQASADQRREVHDQVAGLGSDATAVLPNGYKANLLEARSTGQMYTDAASYADKAFAVAILSHANNAEVLDAKTGSNAGQVLRHEGREFDARGFESFAHDQVTAPWAGWNFGDSDLAPWPAYPTEPDATAAEEGAGLLALGQGLAAAKLASSRVDVDAVLDKHGVPLLDKAPEPATTPPAAPPTPPTAPAPAPAAP